MKFSPVLKELLNSDSSFKAKWEEKMKESIAPSIAIFFFEDFIFTTPVMYVVIFDVPQLLRDVATCFDPGISFLPNLQSHPE